MPLRVLLAALVLLVPATAQQARVPDLEAQRAAMKRLSFLLGRWSGEARLLRESGPVEVFQSEHVQYRLDGLILEIEGLGRSKTNGRPVLQALGLISYDDLAGAYRMRAYNDGRWLETEVKLADTGKGLTWGFSAGDARTSSVLRITETGEWTELTQLIIGSEPPRKFMELTVRRQP